MHPVEPTLDGAGVYDVVRCLRRIASVLTSFTFTRKRLAMVFRRTVNLIYPDLNP